MIPDSALFFGQQKAEPVWPMLISLQQKPVAELESNYLFVNLRQELYEPRCGGTAYILLWHISAVIRPARGEIQVMPGFTDICCIRILTAAEFGIPNDINAKSPLISGMLSENEYVYCITPPNPSEYLTNYTAIILPNQGLCGIAASSLYTDFKLAGKQGEAKSAGENGGYLYMITNEEITVMLSLTVLSDEGISLVYSSSDPEKFEACRAEKEKLGIKATGGPGAFDR
ncbi:hypothetical protein CHS0354_018430 [Potamilus streckersoni]|uniref:Uncharacterized protein n=1 Tax=Potamilus streckersoni TaxID=2493646 RepID=A0AAE0TAX5_9BIVA|nr:hypothetical protein CHS0354_018430 [Potamilus streckersoni]